MRGCCAVLLFLILCLPTLSLAEFETPEHRWTIGYEDGVTLRRFLGETWDVFLGGGPNDSKRDSDWVGFRMDGDDTLTVRSWGGDDSRTESGFVTLGVGRQVLRDQRFWLTAVAQLAYSWSNFQSSSESWTDPGRIGINGSIGHEMITRFELGLRPAYDITSRIVLMVNFGIYYQNTNFTRDEHGYDYWSVTDWTVRSKRSSGETNRIGVYGYYGIDSISFAFRF